MFSIDLDADVALSDDEHGLGVVPRPEDDVLGVISDHFDCVGQHVLLLIGQG